MFFCGMIKLGLGLGLGVGLGLGLGLSLGLGLGDIVYSSTSQRLFNDPILPTTVDCSMRLKGALSIRAVCPLELLHIPVLVPSDFKSIYEIANLDSPYQQESGYCAIVRVV